MKKNLNTIDRIVRALLFVMAGVLFFSGVIASTTAYVLIGITGVLLLTSFISFCPIYSVLGISTCKYEPKKK